MLKLSANLGFLWTELALVDAVYAAKQAGFDAVECHWPYDTPTAELKYALADTGLSMLGLNTARGDAGENGLAAVPGREQQACQLIDQAIDYAAAIDCRNIHVMAGFSDGSQTAEKTYCANLGYACQQAQKSGQTILIEPLNYRDAPGYHLSTLEAASRTRASVGCDNLKIMFDCYHLQIMHGDLLTRFSSALSEIGHIQIASVPARAEPDAGELDYAWLLAEFYKKGWRGFVGAEYKPRAATDQSLQWMAGLRAAAGPGLAAAPQLVPDCRPGGK